MVREAIHIESGHVVAIKMYDKFKLNATIKTCVQREIKLLRLIQSPSIMNLYDATENAK